MNVLQQAASPMFFGGISFVHLLPLWGEKAKQEEAKEDEEQEQQQQQQQQQRRRRQKQSLYGTVVKKAYKQVHASNGRTGLCSSLIRSSVTLWVTRA